MKKSNSVKSTISLFSLVLLILLSFYVITLVVPLVWMVMTSVKTRIDYIQNPLGIPAKIVLKNFVTALENFGSSIVENGKVRQVYVEEMLFNSLLYAIGSAFFSTLSTCVMSYAAAKYDFKFSKIIYSIVIITMILPIVGSLPSEIQLAKSLGFYDNMLGMWVMKFGFLGIYFLVFYAMFKAVPKYFAEAAFVDGATNLQVLIKIMLPLVRNTFFTIMLIKFIDFWNDYYITMTFMPNIKTLSFGLFEYTQSLKPAISSVPMKMAGSLVLVLPVFVLFIVFHKKIMGNVSMGGIKE